MISPAEMRARRARNQCFRCEGQFTPNHVCPNAHLRVMIAAEDEAEEDSELPIEEKSNDTSETEQECKSMQLHLYSTVGITRPSTMKLQGTILRESITVLIDSGASHNFISQDRVKALKLKISPTKEFGVRLDDRHRIACKGVCKGVEIRLQEVNIVADCYPFQLGGVDLILGIAWLETLGEVKVNWQKMTMIFEDSGNTRQLQGNPALSTTPVSFKKKFYTQEVEIGVMLWMLEHMGAKDTQLQSLTEAQKQSLEMVLEDFSAVFQEPTELPPVRHRTHAIVLKPGVTAVNV